MTRRIPIPALLLLAPVLFFDRVCLRGEVFYLRDLFNWFYPWRVFAADSLSRLDFPLWNPWSYSGTPFLANMQSGLLYPPNVVFWLFDFPMAMRLFIVIQFGLAAWFMYLFLRALSCRVASAVTGALGYAYGGWMLAHIEFPNKMAAAAWLPLILLGVVLARRGRPLAGLTLGGIATACCVTAGYPQTTFIVMVGVGVIWGVDMLGSLIRREPARSLTRVAVSLPGICLLGALLAAAQIVPFLEAVSQSAYTDQFDAEKFLALGLHPLHFLDLLMPHIFGLPGYDRFWGGVLLQFWLGHFHVGVPILALAACALWFARPWRRPGGSMPGRRAIGPPLVLLVLAALFCMGDRTALAPFCVAWLPGFSQVRWLSTTTLLVAFPLCWLAAQGLDGVLGRLESGAAGSRIGRMLVVGGGLLALLGGLTALTSAETFTTIVRTVVSPVLQPGQEGLIAANIDPVRGDAVRMAMIAILLAGAWLAAANGRLRPATLAVLVPLVLFVDLKLASAGTTFSAPPAIYEETPAIVSTLRSRPDPYFRVIVPTEILEQDIHMYGSQRLEHFRWAKERLLFNLNLPYRIFSASDGDPLRSARSFAYHTALESGDDDTRGRLLALQNVAVILGQGSGDGTGMTSIPISMPRVHVSAGARRVEPGEALEALQGADWNPYITTIVEDDFPGEPRSGSGVSLDHRVLEVAYTNNTVSIDVETSSHGYLVLADTAYPGWVATVDGRATPIFTANYLFRGIDLPAGRHKVLFVYRPVTVAAGAVGTIAGMLCLAGLMIARRRGREAADQQPGL